MNKRTQDSLALLNSAIALVVLIPVLLISVSIARENASLQEQRPTLQPDNDQPPIIVLRESEGYSFPSGSAELSAEFKDKLQREIVPNLQTIIKKYRCDIVEVVGHTDGQRVIESSTTDANFLPFAIGLDVSVLPGSNADLGLLRAWSVIRFIRNNPWPGGVVFYGYSAGHLISETGSIVKEDAPLVDANRRRIEIRVRRSH